MTASIDTTVCPPDRLAALNLLCMAGDVLDHRIESQTIVWALVVGSKNVRVCSFNAR
jgi:hypothetical protein